MPTFEDPAEWPGQGGNGSTGVSKGEQVRPNVLGEELYVCAMQGKWFVAGACSSILSRTIKPKMQSKLAQAPGPHSTWPGNFLFTSKGTIHLEEEVSMGVYQHGATNGACCAVSRGRAWLPHLDKNRTSEVPE